MKVVGGAVAKDANLQNERAAVKYLSKQLLGEASLFFDVPTGRSLEELQKLVDKGLVTIPKTGDIVDNYIAGKYDRVLEKLKKRKRKSWMI